MLRLAGVLAITLSGAASAGFIEPNQCEFDALTPEQINAYADRLSIFLTENCPIADTGGIDRARCAPQLPDLTMEFLACNVAFTDAGERMACFDHVSRSIDWWALK